MPLLSKPRWTVQVQIRRYLGKKRYEHCESITVVDEEPQEVVRKIRDALGG